MAASAPFPAEPPYEGPALPARSKALSERIGEYIASRLFITILLVLLVLAGLPIAVWLDLRNLSERSLTEQADELSSTIDTIRNYYASNVVGRILAHGEKTQVLPNYPDVPGAIPIPATLSLELGDVINRNNGNTQFRFFSDYPFKNRPPHAFDAFERQALESLRENPHSRVYGVSGSIFDRRVRLATPIIMTAACVSCHNTHPDSLKRDWQVGDVRGIEEFTITQPIAAHIFAFKYLLLYFAFVAVSGLAFIALQHHQSGVIARFNRVGKDQRISLQSGEENCEIPAAAALPRHLRRQGRADRHRAQEVDGLLLRRGRLHVDGGADATGRIHRIVERIPDRNVDDRGGARRYGQ
jgi:hypothetical protein